MIPIRLQLKNFLSYGSELQSIDFSRYQLICLSGKNGHGKSALLDAITWSLWGQARKTSNTVKADLGLVHLGESQMMVIFDFEFNGQLYRVRREFMATYGKPLTTLEFGLLEKDSETIIPLTGKTIKETQQKIEHTLHLTFEAFSNSAFLKQGSSNEFSKKSPRDRKEILASILGLHQFDHLKKRAHEKAKQALTEEKTLEKIDQTIIEELAGIPTIINQLKSIDEEQKILQQETHNLHKEYTELEQQHHKLTQEYQKKHALAMTRDRMAQDEKEHIQTLQEARSEWRMVNTSLRSIPDITQLETQKKEIETHVKKFQETLQTQLSLKKNLLTVQEALQQKKQALQQHHTEKINTLVLHVERLKLEQTASLKKHTDTNAQIQACKEELSNRIKLIQETEQNIAALSKQEHMLTSLELQFNKRKEYYHKWVAEGKILTQEQQALIQKQILAQDSDNPSCPVCEQNLSASRKKFLKERFNKQEQFYLHRLQRLKKLIHHLKERLLQDHEIITQEQTKKQTVSQLKNTAEEQKKQIIELEKNKALLEKERTALEKRNTEIEQSIASETAQLHKLTNEDTITQDAAYKALLHEYNELTAALHALSYDEKQHTEASHILSQIYTKYDAYQKLQKDMVLQEKRKETILKQCTILKDIKQKKKNIEEELTRYAQLEAHETALKKHKFDLDTRAQELQKRKDSILEQKGNLEAQKQKLGKLELQHNEHKKRMLDLQKTAFDYQAIALATSKDGIQALLIEDAIPEIEQEANALLAKLTDNQSQLFIESLRDLKSGGTKETLDIKISDAAGIRPYELFSGGEAFRIDFALRIAISKLLARRAHTSLQTLIIDEGFGSQDDEGLTHIMDSLYKIQDDFEKIIIVSHLPGMKDQFPIHFLVEKGPRGSKVRIIEQG